MSSFGERIKQARISNKMSQEDLAEKVNTLHDAKLNKGMISKWENNREEPRLTNIQYLSEALQVSMDFILGIEPSQNAISPESIYGYRDMDVEVLQIYHSLPNEGKDRWIRAGYDLQTEYYRKSGSKQNLDTIDLINSLVETDDLVVKELARISKWLYEQTGSLSSRDRELLEDSLLLIESDKTKTAEFINLKRKIYEYILPLPYFVTASEKHAHTIEDISKQFNLSKEFVIDAILYYVTSRGSIVESKSHIIDFNDIPLEYDDINQVSKAKVVVIDSEEKTVPNKKGFFKK
ncbi:helix-turn-helix domain-containing protein [Enterococcus wangshanyuanii]|uniref:HTH cro/C1-type domain-containing protein n=1 Tax=Enterococcus wangshanyuanii TaxID=2005703 RepID=A0ABQ1P0G2_9ENTE|nr:helix-turn-helix transcriptional regulator [Enterococcus wangshanyuanii]GGC88336.1 hypothetical protein GCM10011573_17440 [Enterococcus wangshanyuanii]